MQNAQQIQQTMSMPSNPKNDLVSVIALCYNHEKYLLETLDSIKNQTHKNIQLIIMDDCSSDNSVQKIQEWIKQNASNATFIPHTKNQGICKTLNEALRHCRGKYLQVISCDDLLMPYKIKEQVAHLQKTDENVAMVFSDVHIMSPEKPNFLENETLFQISKFNPNVLKKNFFSTFIDGNYVQPLSCLYKKSVFEHIGYYDENLIYEDWDMFLRIFKHYDILWQDRVTAVYRRHTQSFMTTKGQSPEFMRSTFSLSFKHWGYSKESDKIIRQRVIDDAEKFYIKDAKDTLKWVFFRLMYQFNSKNLILFLKAIIKQLIGRY